ncbi:bifunctional diguanylate cyclase/phosphodiesterase [Agrilutibacter solisilvae]|uniref:EAL domain-containing protein n=1 Tax=Agrilutibacter solisilvae TaxID=2763317 RepID=A0A974Y2J1_9GAMM|nr:phosphodiesterase [Lysobacter solisilvae]QSX79260.1 EAL domain-containing protein [Lysobacter solisilvae]
MAAPSTIATAPKTRAWGSDRAVLWFGVVLGVVLALALAAAIANDRASRLAAARHQASALASGTERLVWLELRNLERAMRGIASDAEAFSDMSDEDIAVPVAAMIEGVAARQHELAQLVLLDREGRPLTPAPAPADATPAFEPQAGRAGRMVMGPPQADSTGWTLPLYLPMRDGRGLLAHLRADELQRRVRDLDAGRDGLVQLGWIGGEIVADSRGEAYIGRPLAAGMPDGEIAHIVASRDVQGYPLRVRAGLSEAAVLAPWRRVLLAGTVLYLLYWVGLVVLARQLGRNARSRAHLMRTLTATAGGLRLAQQLGRTGSWEVTRGGPISWSEPVAAIVGADPAQTSATVAEFFGRVHPEDRQAVARTLRGAWRSCEPFAMDFRVVATPGNIVRWLSVRGQCMPDERGRAHMAGTVVDITGRVEAERRLADAERLFRMLFERNPLPFWVFDVGTLRLLEVNQAAIDQYGYSREEFLAMNILDIRPVEQRGSAVADVARRGTRDADDRQIWLHRRRDGQTLEVRIYTADIDFRGRPARLVLAEDVSERMAHERELAWRASHDMTTGLINARALADEMKAHCEPGCRVAYAQLRGLELIEDSLGRRAGADTLRAIARRLERLGHRYGSAGHVRGDEFALLVHDPAQWPQALADLRAELARPVTGEDYLQRLEAWVGTADYPADGEDAAVVLGNAGLAAHQARSEGTPLLRFDREMAQRASDRLQLAGRIHEALDANQFELYFQIIRYAGNGQTAALEALLRWPQADGSFIPPSQFIPISEDSGMIVPLGQWVLREAGRAQRAISDAGFAGVPVAVNMSLAQFMHGDLAADVERVIAEHGLRRGALHLELTESILMTRPEAALGVLRRLRQGGACVSLDDFGTGYSSMSYLRHLPLDALKIDRSFVVDVHQDERNASICLALLALGRSLGLTVVAEGVETAGQYEWLRTHGCDQVQGFGFDRPAPLGQVIERLRTLQRNRGAAVVMAGATPPGEAAPPARARGP